MELLIGKINELKKLNMIAFKHSFEDEGIRELDLLQALVLSRESRIPLAVKIGGCEAISDIDKCVDYGVHTVVAPMIESSFALEKFLQYGRQYKDLRLFINIESKLGYTNIENILNAFIRSYLTGVTVGRSDLSKSYGLDKDYVDSKGISEKVKQILQACKDKKLITNMGGSITKHSIPLIMEYYTLGILNRIETRNVVFNLSDKTIKNLDECIERALDFEISWMEYKYKLYNKIALNHKNRLDTITKRLKNE